MAELHRTEFLDDAVIARRGTTAGTPTVESWPCDVPIQIGKRSWVDAGDLRERTRTAERVPQADPREEGDCLSLLDLSA